MDIEGRFTFVGFAIGLAGLHAADAARFQRSTLSSKKTTFYHSCVSKGAAAAFADASAERSD